jgi:hypothetical protein
METHELGLARFSSTVYASVMVARAKRSTPADGSMTCGTKRSLVASSITAKAVSLPLACLPWADKS